MVGQGDDASDRRLIERIANGDKAAIQTLYARHHTRVFRFVMRQVGSETIAEEVANEVFLEAWRQAAKFEGRSAVSTWLMSVARFKAISALRKRREDQIDETYAELIEDESDTPDVAAQKTDKAALLRQALERLSPDHKAVVDLVYYQELSVAEAGEVLDVPQNTVKTRMFHARKRLHAILEEMGLDGGWP